MGKDFFRWLMFWLRVFTIVIVLLRSLLLACEGDTFEHHQFRCLTFCLEKLLPDMKGSALLMGVTEEFIEEYFDYHPSVELVGFYKTHQHFQNPYYIKVKECGDYISDEEIALYDKYVKRWILQGEGNTPYKSVGLVGLDFRNKDGWYSISKEGGWENKFDCALVMHVMEREKERKGSILLAYDSLKPGGRAVIFVSPPDRGSLDHKIDTFIISSKWSDLIQYVPCLSIPEYKEIIESVGFSIIEEDSRSFWAMERSSSYFVGSLRNWMCHRLDIPKIYQREFISEFGDSLLTRCLLGPGQCIDQKFPVHYFVVEKR